MNIHQASKVWDGTWYAYWLTADGTEDGSRDMVVDGSVTPVYFWHTVPDGYTFYVYAISGVIMDNTALSATGFGSGAALTNGLTPVFRASVSEDWITLPRGMVINVNTDFALHGATLTFAGGPAGDYSMPWRYRFSEDGLPQVMHQGNQVGYKIQDDLTAGAVTTVKMRVTGVLMNNDYF